MSVNLHVFNVKSYKECHKDKKESRKQLRLEFFKKYFHCSISSDQEILFFIIAHPFRNKNHFLDGRLVLELI